MKKNKIITRGIELLDRTIVYVGINYIKLDDGRILYLHDVELEDFEE
jgi:hypothetical protein